MPRVVWPLLHGRPRITIVLARAADGQPLTRELIADTGAGTARSGFELLLSAGDCLLCGGIPAQPVILGGAYSGSHPVSVLRVQIPTLGFDRALRAVALPACPSGFDGLAGFRFLNRFTYGNFGDPSLFGLEI